MKKLFLLPLLLLTSCDLFRGVDYGPAVQANKAQAVVYEELNAAMTAVIINSKSASPEQKAMALADIKANRVDYYQFNTGLEQFLIAAGEIDPERILALAKEAYEYAKKREAK